MKTATLTIEVPDNWEYDCNKCPLCGYRSFNTGASRRVCKIGYADWNCPLEIQDGE